MSGSRWVITPLWLSWSWRSFFVQFFCVFLLPLLNIFCFCYISTISVLYLAHLCKKCSLGISNFLEEISSLSHSVVFLYFFALITEEGFLISPCYSLELSLQMGIFPFLLCFSFLFFPQLFVRQPICFFCISFSWGWSWSSPPVQGYKPLCIALSTLSIRSNSLNLFITSTV